MNIPPSGRWLTGEPLRPAHDLPLALELLDLQHRSYAIEARLIGDTRIPPLHESVDDLQQAALTWVGVRGTDRHVVGAIGFQESAECVDIDRLVVDPSALRRGIGRSLVSMVLDRAGRRRVTVSTGRDNSPARRLYEVLGFAGTGEEEVLPGLWVVRYEWRAHTAELVRPRRPGSRPRTP